MTDEKFHFYTHLQSQGRIARWMLEELSFYTILRY